MRYRIKFWFLKDKKVILGKKPEISLKVGFFEVGKTFIPLICSFPVYMIHHSCLYDSAKTECFGKNIFLMLYTKMLLANQIARFFKF